MAGKKAEIIQRKCVRRQKGNSEPVMKTIVTLLGSSQRKFIYHVKIVCACVYVRARCIDILICFYSYYILNTVADVSG